MKILDNEIPLKVNIYRSFRLYKYLWLILLITVVLDAFSTIKFMQKDGINFEANILIRWLAINTGIIAGLIIGKILQIVAAIGFSALSIKLSRAILLLLLLLNLLAVYHNIEYYLIEP